MSRPTNPSAFPLTKRQAQVMALSAEGLNAREIGEKLALSHRTIETHRSDAILALKARNITHACVMLERRKGKP